MIYRIDMKRFLVHAVDYFTLEDLSEAQYVILSAKVRNGGRAQNMIKLNELYPPPEIVVMYDEYPDGDVMRKAYMDFLKNEEGHLRIVYQTFVNPLLNHQNIIIVCDEIENTFIDVFVEYLHDECGIDVINLNELFTTGRTGEIYIDTDEIKHKAVDIRKAAAMEAREAMAMTADGRRSLINTMTKKEKLWHLKKLGIKLNNTEKKDIDAILMEAWEDDD